MRKLKSGWLLVLVAILCGRGTARGQHWFEYSAPPRDFDWQLFAPVHDSLLDCDEPDANEGYFYNTERGKFWIMRPERAPVGNEPNGQNRIFAFSPSSVNYIYAQFANTNLPNGLTGANKGTSANLGLRFPIAGTGATIEQFNAIDDAYAAHSSGWGNHFEFGWVEGYNGWMVALHQGIDMHRTDQYGVDDKRRRQLGAAQGLDGIDGLPDRNGTLPGGATNPVAPVNGIQSILAIDGLLTVPVLFDDPFGLLSGFVDLNLDQVPDNLDGDANVGFLPNGTPDPGDLVRLAVVFDEVTVTNKTNVNSVEVMAVRRKKPLHGGGTAEIFLGPRYLEFDDRFGVTALGGTLADSRWDNHALNRLVGPQFGLRIAKTSRRWTSSIEGRFMAGANFLSVRQNGVLGDHLTNGAAGVPVAFGGNSFFHRLSDESFSPVGEFNYESAFQITRGVSFKVSWMGTVAGGIQRAANTVVYRLPELGIREKREELFTHGVTCGIEINR